ncbi:MAG TPA: hypothetical protein VIL86_13395 [Tepidisphaeraceae bacterium]|jgi:hypothetical protein
MPAAEQGDIDIKDIRGIRHLRRLAKLLHHLHDVGCTGDRAGNREHLDSIWTKKRCRTCALSAAT